MSTDTTVLLLSNNEMIDITGQKVNIIKTKHDNSNNINIVKTDSIIKSNNC